MRSAHNTNASIQASQGCTFIGCCCRSNHWQSFILTSELLLLVIDFSVLDDAASA